MKSIWTRTRDSVVDEGEKVSEIHTSNRFLILYFLDSKNSKESKVIDIDFKNKRIWIHKDDEWLILSQKLDDKKGFISEKFQTEEQWSKEVAKKL